MNEILTSKDLDRIRQMQEMDRFEPHERTIDDLLAKIDQLQTFAKNADETVEGLITDVHDLHGLLRTVHDAVSIRGDRVCPHGNSTAYPVHGWYCDECWLPIEKYFKEE